MNEEPTILEGELLEEQSVGLAVRVGDSPELAAALLPGAERAASYAAEARANNTQRVYASALKRFKAWCAAHGVSALPAEGRTVAVYLAELADAGRKASTITLALTAINQEHLRGGNPPPRQDPAVQETWKGIRRRIGTKQHGKAALYGAPLLAAVEALPPTLAGLRDRALLLLGFTGAFRRSELISLRVEDLRDVDEGLEVLLRRSKTDQEGEGRTVPIPREPVPEVCPVRAVRAWLEAGRIADGPIFRPVHQSGRVGARALAATGHHVAEVVKRAVSAAGAEATALSGHSLRAGLVTAALKAGRSTSSVMRVTGHTTDAMVRRYQRDLQLFDDSAAAGLLSRTAVDAAPRRPRRER